MNFNSLIKRLLFLALSVVIVLTAVSCDFVDFDALSDLLNGKTEGDTPVCEHSGGSATCKTKAVCSRCSESYGELDPDNHESSDFVYSVNTADNTKHDKKYSCCSAVESTSLHEWNNGQITLEPTENEEGVKTFTCSLCAETKTESVPPSSHVHNGVKTEATLADCTTEGNIEYWYCDDCGKYSSDSDFTNIILREATVIPVTSHTGGTATCTDLAICGVCSIPYGELDPDNHESSDFVYSVNTVDNTKHDKKYSCCQKSVSTESHSGGTATCSAKPVCSVCNVEYGEKLTTHDLEKVILNSTSCTTAATVTLKCKNCTYYESEVIASKLEHVVSSWSVVSKEAGASDCEYLITYVGTCSVCSESGVTKTETEVLHTYSSKISTVAENCSATGVKTYTCSGCGHSYNKNYTDTNAHVWVNDGAATNGVQPVKCSFCNSSKSVVVLVDNKIDKESIGNNELKVGHISMSVDSLALGALSDGEVVIGAEVLTGSLREQVTAKLTDEQRRLLGDRSVYDFTLVQNGSAIGDFNDGYITITVPYTLANNEDPDMIVVWYVSDDGVAETIRASYSNGQVTFRTNHFSDFAVCPSNREEVCSTNGHSYVDGDTVAPTCTLNGYTEKICIRCGEVAFGDVVSSLGHQYSSNPTKVEKSCTESGSLSYSCDRVGCGFAYTFVIPASHNLTETVDYKAPTCKEDGYSVNKCSVCGENERTVLPSDGNHNTFRDYVLVGDSCLDGIEEYEKCRDCDYSSYLDTMYGTHFEKYDSEEGQPIPQDTVVYLAEHLDLSGYGINGAGEGPMIVISSGSCLCKNVCSTVSLRDPSYRVFESEEVWSLWCSVGSAPSEGEQGTFSTMQFGPHTKTYTIKVTVRKENVNCRAAYYVDFLLDYNFDNDTSAKTLSYKIFDAIDHQNTTVSTRLKYEGGQCHDGVIQTTFCNDCQSVVDVYTPYVESGKHFYTTYQVIKYLKSDSNRGHDTKIIEQVCPCGSRKYYVGGACNFSEVKYIRVDDNTSISVKKCRNCNVSYALKTQKGTEFNGLCEKYNYYWISWMCDENGENAQGDAGLYAREIIRSHFYDYTPTYEKIGETPCLYELTQNRICRYCNQTAPVTDLYVQNVFKHDYETTVTVDISGTTTLVRACKHCDNLNKTVTDDLGNQVYKVFAYEDAYALTRTVTTTINNVVLTEKYDLATGELINWERETYIEVSIPQIGCERVSQYIYSNGKVSDVYSENVCETDWSSGQELIPSCAGPGGYVYNCLNCSAKNYQLTEPNGHYYEPIYATEPNDYGMLEIIGFECMVCGLTHEDCHYEWPHNSRDCEGSEVILEIVSGDDELIKIKYFCYEMMYNPGCGLTVMKNVVVKLYGEDGSILSEVPIEVEITDNYSGEIVISKADVAEAIEALSLEEDAVYEIFFVAGNGMPVYVAI